MKKFEMVEWLEQDFKASIEARLVDVAVDNFDFTREQAEEWLGRMKPIFGTTPTDPRIAEAMDTLEDWASETYHRSGGSHQALEDAGLKPWDADGCEIEKAEGGIEFHTTWKDEDAWREGE